MENKKVWFVTGSSRGFGLSIIKQLLEAGELVAATSRNQQELALAANYQGRNFLPLQVDLLSETSIAHALKQTHDRYGKIDVVINNAGYGIGGTIEELSDTETRQAFDVNVFATLNVIRGVMPYLRQQHSGHIINISSSGGMAPGQGWSIYCASKYAVIGLTDVLAADVKSLGIKVTLVAPGAFRTGFLTPESLHLAAKPIEYYKEVRETIKLHLTKDGQQAGDPEKAAAAIINLAGQENPPLYLLLGTDAYTRVLAKLDELSNEIRSLQDITLSTEY